MSDRKSPASSCRKMLSPRGGGAAEEGRETASGAGRPGGPKSGKGRRSGGAAPSAWLQRPPLPQLGPSAGLRICVKTHSGALAARIGGGRDSKNQTRKTIRKKFSSWQISTKKTKKWSSPCRMERKAALWEGAKATSQQEIIDGDRLADLPLISDGPYPIGRSMMGWVEMEMIWKCSWRR